MANLADRLPDNAPGRYYVDSTCIDCDQCRSLAPEFFTRQDDSGLTIVTRQPETAEDVARLEDILAGCATGSIGNDGPA
jgi:ferredoxin